MIESSFAAQYSIRLRSASLTWNEFCTLLSGLLPETPLGRIISIRCEKDHKTIKAFTPDQRKIYRDWQVKKAKNMQYSKEDLDRQMQDLANAITAAFSNKG